MLAAAAGAGQPYLLKALPEAQRLLAWIKASGDTQGRPFALVDKRHAMLYVFDADGRLAGSSVALLGSARGDHIVPGVGERTAAGSLRNEDKTTPAGRFEAQPGRNLQGEDVVWVDYESAFAIHRVRPGKAWKARAERLATATPTDNRVSWGCVVVPVAFYEGVVANVLGAGRSVVYVLPESRPAKSFFAALEAS
ncbi:L,D-transpeptidase [Ramlibacter sp. XY19]|uniref:L,D-transpeptidase n=1 Tax=Ramlibacter paludis TaxID=2908000 RepID=UPI0023DBC40A|nr:L,D-transpeptidase [Ramlibacter paludis]MCG2594112.1 L,D-transpeptidase [Ramlibacter paludis]